MIDNEQWIAWLNQLQAIAQNGLTYSKDVFDQERYLQLREITAQMISGSIQLDSEKVFAMLTNELGYATPKFGVRGVIFQDNKILLVQERADEKWTLPGGWADLGYSPSEAVIKEIQEESGYEAKAIKLLALHDMRKHDRPWHFHHIYKAFFLCEIIGRAPSASNETLDVGFFEKEHLPELSIARVTREEVLRLFEHNQNPEWPTDFD